MIKLCSVNDIEEGQSKGFQLEDGPVFAVKKCGELYIYQNQCPHLGIPLEFVPDQFLDTEGTLIQCSMHGALFRIEDGLCISGPCVNQRLIELFYVIENDHIYLN